MELDFKSDTSNCRPAKPVAEGFCAEDSGVRLEPAVQGCHGGQ